MVANAHSTDRSSRTLLCKMRRSSLMVANAHSTGRSSRPLLYKMRRYNLLGMTI